MHTGENNITEQNFSENSVQFSVWYWTGPHWDAKKKEKWKIYVHCL